MFKSSFAVIIGTEASERKLNLFLIEDQYWSFWMHIMAVIWIHFQILIVFLVTQESFKNNIWKNWNFHFLNIIILSKMCYRRIRLRKLLRFLWIFLSPRLECWDSCLDAISMLNGDIWNIKIIKNNHFWNINLKNVNRCTLHEKCLKCLFNYN